MDKLTKEQQQMVEDNHNLIYWYAKMCHLNVDDYYDLLAIELCQAVRYFDPSRGTLSTFFKVRADDRLYKEYRKANAQKRVHTKVSLIDNAHTIISNDDLSDVIELNKLLEGEYGEIIKLRIEGYSQMEIADKLGTNQSKVSKILKKLKNEYMGGGL